MGPLNWKNIRQRGIIVYHRTFNWGKGIVLDWRDKDNLGYKTKYRIQVFWGNKSGERSLWMALSDLRYTPKV